MPAPFLARLAPIAALLLAGCGSGDEGTFEVAWIGSEESLFASGNRLSAGAQHLRGATQWGLVTLDPQGDVTPALAERWIITDDGLSFIFRLSERSWPDGREMDSASVRRALEQAIAGLDGTALGLDLAPVTDVRAMAGRVIEIRLSAPVPDLLNLLAQPELALLSPAGENGAGGTGPMVLERSGSTAHLRFRPPLERGLPDMPDWQADVREIELIAADAGKAMDLFDEGGVQLVLGGRIGQLPLVDTGPLSRGNVRIDPAIGLFGLRVRRARGVLADEAGREALAMALDREALLARYNVGGWVPTTRIVSPGLPGDGGRVAERWPDVDIAQLRAAAAARVRTQSGVEPPAITLFLGTARGDELLLRDLAAQFASIGVRLVRADRVQDADLVLVDEVARYADPRWFLNQFHCSLRRGLCDEDADYLVEVASETIDPRERAGLLAEAEGELIAANVFIPIGAPLRWSLVRGSVTGFAPNPYGYHPLPPMAEIPR